MQQIMNFHLFVENLQELYFILVQNLKFLWVVLQEVGQQLEGVGLVQVEVSFGHVPRGGVGWHDVVCEDLHK